jgi:antitoxin CptB
MNAAPLSSAGLDPQRRKLLFRARHRGMRELDVLLGGFAEARLAGLSAGETDEFERLMELPDRDVLAWLMGEGPAPEGFVSGLLADVTEFCTGGGRHPLPLGEGRREAAG